MIISSKIESKINDLPEDEAFKELMKDLLSFAPYTGGKAHYTEYYKKAVKDYINLQRGLGRNE